MPAPMDLSDSPETPGWAHFTRYYGEDDWWVAVDQVESVIPHYPGGEVVSELRTISGERVVVSGLPDYVVAKLAAVTRPARPA
jgi:hypothetical protein